MGDQEMYKKVIAFFKNITNLRVFSCFIFEKFNKIYFITPPLIILIVHLISSSN